MENLNLSESIYRVCMQILVAFLPACAEFRKNSRVMSGVESPSWVLALEL